MSVRRLQLKLRGVSGESSPGRPVAANEPAEVKALEALPEGRSARREPGLNPKYTFDSFVVGNGTNLAHAAALAVARFPGKSYNPLFLYGGAGLGKTHLLHAIGHYVLALKKSARVCCLSSEELTNEFVASVQHNQLADFRLKYRGAQVLLIDDIQFLAGKERIQEEFFHTFNALQQNQRQIVLTCDQPVNDVPNLENRLISRFEGGLVTELKPPDFETRLAILQKKAQGMGVALPAHIMSFLANRIRGNIRRLEGALIRVASYATLTKKELNPELLEGLLHDILREESLRQIGIEAIQRRVAEHFKIHLHDMVSRRRPENITFPRQIAMFISRRMTKTSLSAIGEAFGGRDRTTVLRACRLVTDRMETDPQVRQLVTRLERQLTR